MTKIVNPNSPTTTNSLWPIIPLKDQKVSYPGNRSPKRVPSPRMGQKYATYNTNNGIGGGYLNIQSPMSSVHVPSPKRGYNSGTGFYQSTQMEKVDKQALNTQQF